MVVITKQLARKYAKLLNLNTDVIPIWQYAMTVELEHGTKRTICTKGKVKRARKK